MISAGKKLPVLALTEPPYYRPVFDVATGRWHVAHFTMSSWASDLDCPTEEAAVWAAKRMNESRKNGLDLSL